MTRSQVYFAFTAFFDRAVCATIADANLARAYVESIRLHIESSEASFQPIDEWSVQELRRATQFLHSEERWVLEATGALVQLAQATQMLEQHKQFLREHGLLPEYLAA
jgi:hypothetical protein